MIHLSAKVCQSRQKIFQISTRKCKIHYLNCKTQSKHTMATNQTYEPMYIILWGSFQGSTASCLAVFCTKHKENHQNSCLFEAVLISSPLPPLQSLLCSGFLILHVLYRTGRWQLQMWVLIIYQHAVSSQGTVSTRFSENWLFLVLISAPVYFQLLRG